ncbi:MAG: AMP-binding protein [Bryobacterales bacterium]|nr:AMP-binding protein [Bryobacterales bacterium]
MTPLDYEGPVERAFAPWDAYELAAGVTARFLRMAERLGGRPAVADGDGAWTYAELAAIAGGVQRALRYDASPVALALSNSRWSVAAMLGVMASGRPYVPLPASQPQARRDRVLAHSGAGLVVTRDWMAQLQPAPLENLAGGDALAYILYTSGSTGEAKGVYQNQHNLLHDVMQYTHSAHLASDDRLTVLYPAEAIGSVRDVFGALLNGGSLLVHDLAVEGMSRLIGQLRSGAVTVYHSVPPLFRTVMGQLREPLPAAVRLAYLAGDRVLTADLDLFTERFAADSHFYTGIGCTECSTLYRQWFPRREAVAAGQPLAVGRAIPARRSTLSPDGEIEVTSQYLALGYWRDAELSAARFAAAADEPGARVFRPGDRGAWREDGLMEHLGRADQQVKIRGFRVELGEIEQAMARYAPNVAVVFDGAQLTAMHEGAPRNDWAETLREVLPAHMIPARFLCVPELPRLANRKFDRRAIAAAAASAQAPRLMQPGAHCGDGGLETLVCEVFAVVLGTGAVHAEADFFALGGDSLQALQATVELERRLGLAIAIHPLASARTPREVARLLSDWLGSGAAAQRDAFYYLPGVDGAALSPVGWQALRYPDDLSLRTIPELAAWMRARLRIGPKTRPWLLGYSFGGRVAFELARQLTESSPGRVPFLGIIDMPATGVAEDGHPPGFLERLARGWQLAYRAGPGATLASMRRRAARQPIAATPFVQRNREASRTYTPLRWDGEVTLLRSAAPGSEDLGWSAYCRRVNVYRFPGSHDIADPLVAPGVAAALRQALQSV